MTPRRDSTRASATSTSSIAWTQARSETVSRILSLLRLGPNRSSDGKEHRFVVALQPDVKAQYLPVRLADERRSAGRRHAGGRAGLLLRRCLLPRKNSHSREAPPNARHTAHSP